MEKLYYILDTTTNTIVIDNLTMDQSINWMVENADPTVHIVVEK